MSRKDTYHDLVKSALIREGWTISHDPCAVHIDIVGDRIVIECNDTEEPLVAELVEMGVERENISLNFLHPDKLMRTEVLTTKLFDEPILSKADRAVGY